MNRRIKHAKMILFSHALWYNFQENIIGSIDRNNLVEYTCREGTGKNGCSSSTILHKRLKVSDIMCKTLKV